MPKLFFCNTIYDCKPPSDINPLILQSNIHAKFLVLCAREGQVIRINNLLKDPEYINLQLVHCGWWEFHCFQYLLSDGSLNFNKILSHDVVIILDRERIDPMFIPLMNALVSLCRRKNQPSPPSKPLHIA